MKVNVTKRYTLELSEKEYIFILTSIGICNIDERKEQMVNKWDGVTYDDITVLENRLYACLMDNI